MVKEKVKDTLGGYNSIDGFVDAKLRRCNSSARDFAALFEIMFSEKENVMYESTSGYRTTVTTYGETYREIESCAASLSAILSDCEPNCVVGIYMSNSLRWIEMFWAVLKSGFRPLLMNMRLDGQTLEYALKASSAKAVISESKSFSVRTISVEEVFDKKAGLKPASGFGSEIMVMSSGTSEHVKICAYSAEEFYHQIQGSYSIIKQCAQIKKHYDGRLKLLTFLPFYHIFGLVAVYIWFAFFSRTFVQLNDMQPQTIINTIKRHKVTHIFAVPLFWEKVYSQAVSTIKQRGEKTEKKFEKGMKISRKIGDVPLLGSAFSRLAFKEVRENMFGGSVRFMITGGSCISTEVMEFFNAVGYRLADGYGMTEIGITSVELSGSRKRLNSCSVGMPMAGVEYKINDSGELLVRGRAMAKYIIEDGEIRPNNGWFNTHDLAEFDGSCYRITGRRDDLIAAPNGENLNPNLIESKLDFNGARGVCLAAVKTGAAAEPVLIVSVNKYIDAQKLSALQNEVSARLSQLNLSGQISRVVYTDQPLMKPDEFKLNRKRLSAELSNGTLSEVSPDAVQEAGEDDEITRAVRGLFALALEKSADEIGYASDFFLDEGGSSLDYFAVISQLEEMYGVKFPDSDTSLNSVKAIHDYIIGSQ